MGPSREQTAYTSVSMEMTAEDSADHVGDDPPVEPSVRHHVGPDGRIHPLGMRCGESSSRLLHRPLKYILTAILGVFVASQVVTVVLVAIDLAKDVRGYEISRPEWPLYKNTRFESCAAQAAVEEGLNCTTLIRDGKHDLGNSTFEVSISEKAGQNGSWDFEPGDWCCKVRCLSGLDYKILPTEPLPIAYSERANFYVNNGLDSVQSLTTAGLFVLALLRNEIVFKSHFHWECSFSKQPLTNIWYAIIVVHGTTSFAVWWYSFAGFDGSRPGAAAVLGWIELFELARSCHTHPIACRLRNYKVTRRVAAALFYILALALWAGTVGLAHRLQDHYHDPAYECLREAFDDAPGAATCPLPQICRSRALLSTAQVWDDSNYEDNGLSQHLGIVWMILAVVPALRIVMVLVEAALKFMSSNTYLRRLPVVEDLRSLSSLTDTIIALRNAVGIILNCWLILTLFVSTCIVWHLVRQNWRRLDREATVAYDVACHVIHVHVSPWAGFRDVDDDYRVCRAVRAWFHS